MPRNPDVPCADCGTLIWRGRGSLTAGTARCRPCRRLNPTASDPTKRHTITCGHCAAPFTASHLTRKYCTTTCSNAADSIAKQIRPLDDRRVKRTQREHAAPGLSTKARAKLNTRWQTQGRACTYCPRVATTVDHVVPLVRGGTNHEGNLTPACKSCNSSKSGFLLIEWRTGLRLPRMVTVNAPLLKRDRGEATPTTSAQTGNAL